VTVTRELVAQDLLTVLHSLPIEAIGMFIPPVRRVVADRQAVNSISIVLKVRYVACGLLDAGDTTMSDASPDQPGTPGGRKAENSLRESDRWGFGLY
jgi:hypothetical protein